MFYLEQKTLRKQLRLQYSGAEDVISQQYNITSKYSKKDVQKATRELNGDDVEDLETRIIYSKQVS